MKRLLSLLALVAGWPALGAVTINPPTIESSGWVMSVTMQNQLTNGVPFDFGFLTNNTGPSKVQLTVYSPGFDNSGVSNWTARLLYATKCLRRPYPNQTMLDCTNSGANVICRLALSEYVLTNDVVSNVTFAANWYSNNTPATNFSSIASSSTNRWPKCIANWSWPGWMRITSNTMTLRAVGFHKSAESGRPLRYMEFIAQDQHSHAVTNKVMNMSYDRTLGDPTTVCEYIGVMDLSSFTALDLVRCDFRAVPFNGDANSIRTTLDNVYTQPTAMWASITNFYDPLNQYGFARAIVNRADGNDGTGIAACASYWATNQNPAHFLTINAAAAACKATNNTAGLTTNSHNDCGGSVIYVATGNYNWLGASRSTTGTPKTWVTVITNGSGAVTITNVSGNQTICGRTYICGLTVQSPAVSTFTGSEVDWFDGCNFNCTGDTATIYQDTIYYLTRSTVVKIQPGIYGFSGTICAPAIVRGCDFQHSTSVMSYMVIGNTRTTTNTIGNSVLISDTFSGIGSPTGTNMIVACNSFYGITGGGSCVTLADALDSYDFAIVQNLFEEVGTANTVLLGIAKDSSVSANVQNVVWWNNTIVGNRHNGPYNDAGATALWRTLFSKKNNLLDDDNIKADTFGTPNSARIGNWSGGYGVGISGNWCGTIGTIGGSGAYQHGGDVTVNNNFGGFAGLNTFETPGGLATNYQKYVAHKAWGGPGNLDNTGFGNYRLTTQSPILNWGCEWLLPYDLEGNARGGFDPPGAYASASPRKGAGFFGQ